MNSHPWNISVTEGSNLLENLMLEILDRRTLNMDNIGTMLKEKAERKKIILRKNGKRRNINHFIRAQYKGLQNFIQNRPEIFVLTHNSGSLKIEVSLTINSQNQLSKKEAESEDFVWID